MKKHLFYLILLLNSIAALGAPIAFDKAMAKAIALLQKQIQPTQESYSVIYNRIRNKVNEKATVNQAGNQSIEETTLTALVDSAIMEHITTISAEQEKKRTQNQKEKKLNIKSTITNLFARAQLSKISLPKLNLWGSCMPSRKSAQSKPLPTKPVQTVPTVVAKKATPQLAAPVVVHAPAQHDETPFRQVTVPNQKRASCGLHAACNSLAMQRLFERNQPITQQTMAPLNEQFMGWWKTLLRQSREVNPFIADDNIEAHDMLPITEKLGLKNVYFIRYDRTENNFYPAGVSADINKQIETALREYKNSNHSGIMHIICNTDGHWVQASIIKYYKKTAIVRYSDSMNTNYQIGNTAFFINYIQDRIF